MSGSVRKATIPDVSAIRELVATYASERKMLPRPLGELYENVRDFFVCEVDGKVVGCAALHFVWEDLAEVKSLAVRQGHQRRGYGSRLVEACLEEARALGVPKVLALTYSPAFFERFGFSQVSKDQLPHKIWAECVRCPFFPDCDEVALLIELQG